MAKFIYIGDEPSVFIFGLTFPKDVPVDVTDAHALRKLPNHSHFQAASEMPAPVVLPVVAPEIGASLTPEPKPEQPAAPKRVRRKKDETT